jgi:hypothetical protein
MAPSSLITPGPQDYTETASARQKAATGWDPNSTVLGSAFSLFLLFLQEIISEGHGLDRRNPRFPAPRSDKEQRLFGPPRRCKFGNGQSREAPLGISSSATEQSQY